MRALLLEQNITALAWLVGGFALCAAETLTPGVFFFWIGAAAALVGAAAFYVTLSFTQQLLLFGLLTAVLGLLGRRVYDRLDADPQMQPENNTHAMVGSEFLLGEAIVRGYGRIRVGDSSWRVAGPDTPAGVRVRVVAIENRSLLRVERIE